MRSGTKSLPAPTRPLQGRPDSEAFRRLLKWLDAEAEAAGQRYADVHRRLTKLFSCNGCDRPEELADDTLDRVMAKVDALQDVRLEHRLSYLYGVARNVKREYCRALAARPRWTPVAAPPEELLDKERRDRCLQQCLNAVLSASEGRLMIRYYSEEGQAKIDARRRLARSEKLTPAALRKRVQRLGHRLFDCLRRCCDDRRHGGRP